MPKKKVIKRKRVGEEKKERKVTKRYLNPRVALVISCLYFITFVLSPVKYDIFMVSMMSKISNAMFIISLVVSSMTIVEIYFGRFTKGKKVAIISLLIPVGTFLYLVVNSLIEDNYYILYIIICSIICVVYDLVFFKIRSKKFIDKYPLLSYGLYIIVLSAIYIFVLLNYKYFYSTDEAIKAMTFGKYLCSQMNWLDLGLALLYSTMYMGVLSIVIFNIFNKISKKS